MSYPLNEVEAMGEAEINAQLQELRTDIANVKTDIANVKADVRVAKHDVNSLQQSLDGFGRRFEKFQEQMVSKMDGISDKIVTVNGRQDKGVAFVAGASAAVTALIGFVIWLASKAFHL